VKKIHLRYLHIANQPTATAVYYTARSSYAPFSFPFVFVLNHRAFRLCTGIRGPPTELSLRPLKELMSLSRLPPMLLISLMPS
jgi:hypothetical protein